VLGAEGADKLLENGKGRLPLKKLAQNVAFNAYISSTRQLHMTKRTDTGFNEHRPGNGAAATVRSAISSLTASSTGSYAIRRKRRSSINCQHFDDPPAIATCRNVTRCIATRMALVSLLNASPVCYV
jgi:hypothetical protein